MTIFLTMGRSEEGSNGETLPTPEMRSHLDRLPDLAIYLDDKGIIRYVNTQITPILQLTEDEWLGKDLVDEVLQIQKERQKEFYSRLITQGAGERLVSSVVQGGDGVECTLEFNGRGVYSEQELRGYLLIARDVTERNREEEELQLFKQAVESVNECILITDMDGQVQFINHAFGQTFGYTQNELYGESVSLLRPEGEQLAFDEDILARTGEDGWTGELKSRKSDGTVFPARFSTSLIYDDQVRPVALICVIQDISQEKQIEEELIKAEKLESLGVLAGGIAHDFNNILTSVIGNISLAKLSLDDQERTNELLEAAEGSARGAARLTGRLLTFARGGSPKRETVQIDTVLKDALDISLSGSNVGYDLELEPNVFPVSIDQNQILQALQNVSINADQAMPEGGRISVQAENVFMDRNNRVPGLEGRYYVKIAISDEGEGIDQENLEKIFDPFFSTKDTSSGLGLAVAYSIVNKHNGTIIADSVPGEGATFTIYLPAVVETEHEKEISRTGGGDDTSLRVLIMDDEYHVRMTSGRMLEFMGHEVDYAADGEEAVKRYSESKETGNPFDLVIMDLTVSGGMGGEEAIRHLLELDPQAKAIVSSGYSNSEVLGNYREHGFVGRVDKPYTLEKLSAAVREVFSEAH